MNEQTAAVMRGGARGKAACSRAEVSLRMGLGALFDGAGAYPAGERERDPTSDPGALHHCGREAAHMKMAP